MKILVQNLKPQAFFRGRIAWTQDVERAFDQGQWVALLGWSAASFHLKDREQWLGWSNLQRRSRLHLLAQNSRFVVLVDRTQWPNLASRSLGLVCQRLSPDWQQAYGHPIAAVEGFVDSQLFRGTAYKGTGWELLGQTDGFGRVAEDCLERRAIATRPVTPEQLGLAGAQQLTQVQRTRSGPGLAFVAENLSNPAALAAKLASPADELAKSLRVRSRRCRVRTASPLWRTALGFARDSALFMRSIGSSYSPNTLMTR